MIAHKKFVVIGGGTGTFSVLSGLKKFVSDITAVVTMADSGGSAKKERDEWGLLPSSDVRKSLIALSGVGTQEQFILRRLFEYRYSEGRGVVGMTFGNLFLVALTKILGSQKAAIEMAGKILHIKGKVLPVTLDKVDLVAEYEDGTTVIGEHFIDEPTHNGKLKIIKLSTHPQAYLNNDVRRAILESDCLIIGPGGFYTTILANFVIKGMPETISKSRAKKIFILNLMTEYGQTFKWTASRFINELSKYVSTSQLDYVLINNAPIPPYILSKYKRFHTEPVINDLVGKLPFKVISCDLISSKIQRRKTGDRLKRSIIRHDKEKLAKTILELLNLV